MDEQIKGLREVIAKLAGALNIQREAIAILMNPPPTAVQMQIALRNRAQDLEGLGLDKTWSEEELEAYQEGIQQTLALLNEAMLKASLKGAPNLPPSLK